jgi:type 2A phosphatase activator TIP41
MPGCLFLLARFTLRVDQVLFRTFDTRIYHSFTSSPHIVVKEVVGMEAPYDAVKQVRAPNLKLIVSFVLNPTVAPRGSR